MAPLNSPRSWDSAPDSREFDIRGLLGLLRRQAGLIAITLVVVLSLAGLAIFALKPVYTASALVLVDPSQKDLLDPTMQNSSAGTDSVRVDSEVELVRAQTTLLRAVDTAGLLSDPEFGVRLGFTATIMALLRIGSADLPTGDAALQSVVNNLKDALTVRRQGPTYLISISVRSEDPAKAAMIANAVAEAYIHEQLNTKIASVLASRDVVGSRLADAQTSVATSEQAFDAFIDSNIDTISRETGRTELVDLRRQLERANADRVRLASLVETGEASLRAGDYETVAASLRSQALDVLIEQREALQQVLAGAAEGAPQTIDLRAQLADLDEQLQTTTVSELTTIRQQVAATQQQASNLRSDLRTRVIDSDLPPAILTSIYGLQQTAELARSQYQTMLSRLNDLEAQAYLQLADSRIVSQAFEPTDPSFPNPPLILAFAAFGGLALGIGLAFLNENFVGGFTSEEQLQSVLRVPVAAAVPKQRANKGESGDTIALPDYVKDKPLSVFSEAVRRLRAGVDIPLRRNKGARRTRGGVVIMVSSAAPDEGKTTLALALAQSYALSGRRTLLIDCDMRKPSVHRLLGIEPEVGEPAAGSERVIGLADYLAMDKPPSVEAILHTDTATGLELALGVRRSEIATDHLVTGEAFAGLMKAAVSSFDVVVLDTPPVGPVVDGLYLAPFADVIVLVVRWATTYQQEVRAALAALNGSRAADADIVAVLNQQDGSERSYRQKYAGYYVQN